MIYKYLSWNKVKRVQLCLSMAMMLILVALQFNVSALAEDAPSEGRESYQWLSIYEDSTASLSAQEIRQQLQYFSSVSQWPSYGETKSHIWLHIDFSINRPTADKLWLELGNPVTDYINVYQVNHLPNDKFEITLIQETGDARLFESRGLSLRNFLIPLNNETQQSYLVEIYGKSPMAIPLQLGELSDLFETMVSEVTFIYLLFGIMIAMTLYNGFLFLGTRVGSYGWYTLYLASIFMFLVFSSGTGYRYLWYNSAVLQHNLGYVFISLFLFGAFRFTRDFLNIKQLLPKFDKFFSWFSFTPLFIIISLLIYPPLLLKLSTFYMLTLTLLVPTLAVIAWVKGTSAAWLFLLSWIFMVVGMLTYNLAISGALPLNFYTLHAGEIGVSIESILLSFALAYRIRTIEQKSKEQEAESFQKIEAAFALVERSEAAKDSFLKSSSHQLKTPMHALLSHIQLLRESIELDEDSRLLPDVMGADKSATLLFFQLDNLFAYSQIVAGDLCPIIQKTNIRNECSRILNIWSDLFVTENKRIECSIDSKIPQYVDIDWFHIRKIIRIAMENALTATVTGAIKVKIDVNHLNEQPMLRCVIEDSGPGVPVEILEWLNSQRVEDRWTDASSGLFICKNLNDVIKGELTLENKPSGGAILTLNAPIYGVDDKQPPTLESLAEKVVMVVDDVKVNRTILSGMLRKIGVQVVSASSGEEALGLLEGEHVDLILMDCQMPGLSGQETTLAIRTRQDTIANTSVIAVSANDNDLDRQSCFDVGMQDFMSKPVRIDALHQKLKEWLH
ncbi:MAG: CheY-like chemotaxis protein/signal transduction histidine kinase [Reinekea sp.]|jgi:CheY-like chemotaxis protein/signal transduction histidine kinase